jgi:hypothetical protein
MPYSRKHSTYAPKSDCSRVHRAIAISSSAAAPTAKRGAALHPLESYLGPIKAA